MKFISTVLLLLCFLNTNAQIIDSINQEAIPLIGTNQLAIKYYGIDFTKEQREEIDNIEIELIFLIDEYGNPTLSEINGVSNKIIVDSLKNKTNEIGKFNPTIKNGVPESSIYFIKLSFPSYKFNQRTYGLLQGSAYNEARLDDFEYLIESGQNIDLVIGGFINQFIGNPSKHLSIGGGMKFNIEYTAKNKLYYGLNISFAQNGLKEDYPINSQREQISPVTGFVGFTFGKWISNYSLQFDLDLSVHNITEKIGDVDPDWVQLNGWSPGIVLNYPILLGSENPSYYYGAPALIGNNLNLSVGLRYLSYSLNEATGFMAEFGVSYRMKVKGVKEYKLKDQFYSR